MYWRAQQLVNSKCSINNTIHCHSSFIQTNGDNSYTDVCPLLVANSGDVTDYTQPIDVAQDLTLKTLKAHVSYCVYSHSTHACHIFMM